MILYPVKINCGLSYRSFSGEHFGLTLAWIAEHMTVVWHIVSPQALADARAAIGCHMTSSLTSVNSWRLVQACYVLKGIVLKSQASSCHLSWQSLSVYSYL